MSPTSEVMAEGLPWPNEPPIAASFDPWRRATEGVFKLLPTLVVHNDHILASATGMRKGHVPVRR